MMSKSKIFIAGHRGMVGGALARKLSNDNDVKLILRSKDELDLLDQVAVKTFFETEKPDKVYMAAAKVGGIHANNTFPADFIYQNLVIQTNIIHQAFLSGVSKLLFLGSSCIYPRAANQPMNEKALLSGYLEPTNEPYAIAKIAGIKLCESYNRQYGVSHGIDYRSVMPSNLYGAGDNYHPMNSHVIPGLIRRMHEAKTLGLPSVTVWGTGKVRREFLNVDDMADACIFVMNYENSDYKKITNNMLSHINVGSGSDIAISELAGVIAEVVGFEGEINFDVNKPDGPLRKLLDVSKLNTLGWYPKIKIEDGLIAAYKSFKHSLNNNL
jgi:GDP-L-fucose synthase